MAVGDMPSKSVVRMALGDTLSKRAVRTVLRTYRLQRLVRDRPKAGTARHDPPMAMVNPL